MNVPRDCLLKRRLYCETHSTLFYTLYVYPTRKAFHAAYRARHPHDRQLYRSWMACCCIAGTSGPWRRGELGSIYFSQQTLSPQLIAHEATHAALAWWLHIGLEMGVPSENGFASLAEERFCYVLDGLVGQIHWRCKQAGLLET